MKLFISLLLSALMVLSVCACSKEDNKKDDVSETESVSTVDSSEPVATPDETVAATTASSDEKTIPYDEQQSDTEKLKAFVRDFNEEPTVEKQTVYENDIVTIAVDRIDYDMDTTGPSLVFSVTNHGSEDIHLQSPYAVVNDKMISPIMNEKVAAGKTASCAMTFLYFDLAISDITQLETIECMLDISNNAYQLIEKTDMITIATTATPQQQQEESVVPESDDQIAYDKDGIKIVVKGLNTDHTYDDVGNLSSKLVVSIVNDTKESLKVSTKELTVNGCEDITRDLNCQVFPGKEATYYNRIYENDLNACSVTNIDSIKISFLIKKENDKKPIETKVVDVTLSEHPAVSSTMPNYAAPKVKSTEAPKAEKKKEKD